MKIVIASRSEIERGIVVRTPYVVISISDPGSPQPRLKRPATFRDAIFVQFHDAEPAAGSSLPAEIVLMSSGDAKNIWKFVDRHCAQVGAIVVHCEQGMSRSPAVAAAICRRLGLDDSRFFVEYQPNQYVYQLLLGSRQLADERDTGAG